MSSPWTTPDPRRAATAPPAFGVPVDAALASGPSVGHDAAAGVLTAVVTLLVGAPLGLLWAALAPRVDVLIQGENVQLVDPGSSAFIAGDAAFLLAVTLAGVIGGVAAWRLASAHGPAVVVGLALGGLAAAYVAMVVGQQVGLAEVTQAVSAGQQGALELSLRLRAKEAVVGWPVGGLLGYVGASLLRGR